MSGRPLDVLEESLGETVTVLLKDGTNYHGVLTGYDQHLNLVLEDVGQGPRPQEPEDLGASVIEDTMIIRGDNVVSIKP